MNNLFLGIDSVLPPHENLSTDSIDTKCNYIAMNYIDFPTSKSAPTELSQLTEQTRTQDGENKRNSIDQSRDQGRSSGLAGVRIKMHQGMGTPIAWKEDAISSLHANETSSDPLDWSSKTLRSFSSKGNELCSQTEAQPMNKEKDKNPLKKMEPHIKDLRTTLP